MTFCGGAWRARDIACGNSISSCEACGFRILSPTRSSRVPLARAPRTAAERQSAGDKAASCLKHSNVTIYADDTVIYVAGKDISIIEIRLSSDMELIAEWCEKNELILNTTAGKTESMLFGTAKNLRQQSQTLNVTYRDQLIRSVTTYKYLGVEISHSLNMTTNFDNTYKKACGRLRLLRKIRPFLNVKAAKAIYQGMVLPILTYCGLLNLKLSRTQEDKLLSIHHRALDI